MADFEEYRQPWETGPHWELKREFMEKYRNDFPSDRLLCLAQAYSNIELLHCRYPEPVMQEVAQLACQLQGCKRFREADADLERRRKEKLELQPRKAGKRNLSDEIPTKPFKLIKFCCPETAFNQSKSSNKCDKNPNDFIQHDIRASTNNSGAPKDLEAVNKNSVSEKADNIDVAVPSTHNNIIFSLSHSPDFTLMQKIASAIPKKTGTPLESIESAIEVSGLGDKIKYVFVHENMSVISCQFYVGSTLLSTGRDGTEKNAKNRAVLYGVEILSNLSNLPYKTLEDVKQELEKWKKTNWNSCLLWSELSSSDLELKLKILRSQLSDIGKNPAYADLHLILSIVEKLLSQNKKVAAAQKIQEAASKLKFASQVCYFHFGEDPDTLLHQRLFHCDFVIKNIFICHSKASGKKRAKADASEKGFNFLINFIENSELEKQQNVQEQVQSIKINIESSEHTATDMSTDEKINNYFSNINNSSINVYDSSTNHTDELNKLLPKQSKTENYSRSNADKMPEKLIKGNGCDNQCVGGSKRKPELFRINHSLLNNSRNRQLVVFDLSETGNQNAASSILHVTAGRCKKNLNYEKGEISTDRSRNSQTMSRCSVTLNEEEIGQAEAFTEKEAKSKAAENALQFLQKHFYTIKVKNEIEESFIVSRSHVLNAENPSSVLAESNVGCKMLKMMGWTGGGIGKNSGITEPIVANDHRFGQGLGFSNGKAQERSFKQKVDALLKDYSQSNTTSDLIFSTEFSKEERKEIHQLATRYNLSSVSRGKDQQRQLFIGRKISPMDLLEHLIKAGGSTPKYELEDRSISDRTSISQVEGWQLETPLFH